MSLPILMILLFVIGLVSSSLASFIGLGGGLVAVSVMNSLITDDIISVKLMAYINLVFITLLSSLIYFKQKRNIDFKIIGFIIIGLLPTTTISHIFLSDVLKNNKTIFHACYLSIVILVTLIFFFKKYISFNISNYYLPLAGGVIGILAGGFGLSGGVLFIPLLISLKKMDIKDAAVHSLLLKLFASLVNIMISAGKNEFVGLNNHENNLYWFFPIILIAGSIFGSYIGPKLNKLTPSRYINYLVMLTMTAIMINEILKTASVY